MSMNENAEEIIEQYEKLTQVIGWQKNYGEKLDPGCGFVKRKSARHMKNPGEEQWKGMERLVGHVIGNQKH